VRWITAWPLGADDLGGQSERRRFSLVAIEGERRYRDGCRDGNEAARWTGD